ncbi:uncharacterized protein LOC131294579 [Anopheles ziemanni]|uniref:uncharacterized protein LOC131265199 n=1 Tax=Anopheles coustani TaxID=139045 RepID=UPI002659297C|nr:uncharacterized protein LOC131265199 [Anopheles coustani]XP_058178607.1 uncharacterized protein LOC131294579 [Anopheles ziemanni]
MSAKLIVQQESTEKPNNRPASPRSSEDSFRSALECIPEPHAIRPGSLLQQFDHMLGVIWHCFDTFRQRFFASISTESIGWALDFLESTYSQQTDELHFVMAYLRCVQSLVQLAYGKFTAKTRPTDSDGKLQQSSGTSCDREEPLREPSRQEMDVVPFEELIEELLRLYALLARYKIELHRSRVIDQKQLKEIECLLEELDDSLTMNDSSLVQ